MFTQHEVREIEDVWQRVEMLSAELYELKMGIRRLRDRAVMDSNRVEQQAHRVQS